MQVKIGEKIKELRKVTVKRKQELTSHRLRHKPFQGGGKIAVIRT